MSAGLRAAVEARLNVGIKDAPRVSGVLLLRRHGRVPPRSAKDAIHDRTVDTDGRPEGDGTQGQPKVTGETLKTYLRAISDNINV